MGVPTKSSRLAGQRATRARHAAAQHGALERTDDPHPVDAVVLVEALVLGGQERLHQGRRDLGEGHHGAPLEPEVGDEPAVGGVDLGGLGGIVVVESGERRTGVAGTGAGPRGEQHREAHDHDAEETEENAAAATRQAEPSPESGGLLRSHVEN